MHPHLVGLLALLATAAAVAQGEGQDDREPVPTPNELALAQKAVLGVVVDLLAERVQDDEAIRLLLSTADASDGAAVRWLLLEHAHRLAFEARDERQILRVANATIAGFDVDPVDFLQRRMDEIRAVEALEPRYVTGVWLERLERASAAGDAALARRYSARALDECRAIDDPLLKEQVAAQVAETAARQELAQETPALFERVRTVEPMTALSHAAECTKHAKATADAVAARTWRREALAWYGAAWRDLDELERTRAIGLMDAVGRRAPGDPELGRIRFESADALDDLVLNGGDWHVEHGALRATAGDDGARATFRYAFRRIRSVTVRGAIKSEAGLNFRFAAGPVSVILNWEVADENHMWVGGRRVITSPRRLVVGREHEMVLRRLGDRVVVLVDRELLFDEPLQGELAGTVSVYPALGSEILVREIVIDGDVDPGVTVSGPIPPAR